MNQSGARSMWRAAVAGFTDAFKDAWALLTLWRKSSRRRLWGRRDNAWLHLQSIAEGFSKLTDNADGTFEGRIHYRVVGGKVVALQDVKIYDAIKARAE